MYEKKCDAVMTPDAPCTSMCDKVRKLHEMISDARGIAKGTRTVLFGPEKDQEKVSEPSVTCMSEELDIMLRQMKEVLNDLSDIRNRIG